MEFQEALGLRLRTLRLGCGLTQAQVAQVVGMHRTQYAHVEAGRNAVAAWRLPALAKAFGLSGSELLASAWEVGSDDSAHLLGRTSPSRLVWVFGRHELHLSALNDSQSSFIARMTCVCSGDVLWSKQFRTDDPLDMLRIRSEAVLIQGVAKHLSSSDMSLTEKLSGEATMVALGAVDDALHVLDKYADARRSECVPLGESGES